MIYVGDVSHKNYPNLVIPHHIHVLKCTEISSITICQSQIKTYLKILSDAVNKLKPYLQ